IARTCARTGVLDGGAASFDGPTADGLPCYHRLMGTDSQ
ncbi:MAG: hypothetical protein QOG68_1181, partial [Solirubrobacteraceae bacterium]|nr:hypothetical protein [Solirubrobacteraceae bacterium]